MDIKKVVVAGGGVLGSQIAYQSAFCGFDVTVWLRSEGSIERAKPKFERLLWLRSEGSIERAKPKFERLLNIYLGTLEQMKTDKTAYCRGFSKKTDLSNEEIDSLKEQAQKAFDSLKLTTSYEEAVDDADIVIEAIAEDPNQKIPFYEELAKYLPEKTIVVTNSSTLLPSQFAEHTGRPEKYLAFHFANNIWAQNTAEVMPHPGTEQKYFDAIVQFAEDINMIPIKVLKEQPGYVLNSLLVPFLSAGQALWAEEVAEPETIDLTWRVATGAPNGPFQILDIVGLVTAYNIILMDPRSKDPETTQGKIALKLKEKIDAGETGINAGKGFYEY